MSKFEVQITPLHRDTTNFTDADITVIDQFSDLEVFHPLNDGRTATVVVPITSPAVLNLKPYAFAVRILYEDRREPVFWGPSNISTDFGAGTCTLEAQDPSLRLAHHYVRRGDVALTYEAISADKGIIDADPSGIRRVIEAGENVGAQITRDDPTLALKDDRFGDMATQRVLPMEIERGQECWQIILDISKHVLGPDFDMAPMHLIGYDFYCQLNTYDDLGRTLTSATPDTPLAGEVVFDFGLGADNLIGMQERPGRPTTHAHVLSGNAKHRRSAGSTVGSADTGIYVDWVPVDFNIKGTNDAALKELADARVEAYGIPPKMLEVQLRPDAVINHNYGRPAFVRPTGTRAPTFYIGDRVTVRAQRGNRSYNAPARIVEVRLTQPGPQGPAVTVLKMVPTIGGTDVGEEA